jgi:hypothetical protein
MYEITWRDRSTDLDRSIKVSTARSVREVTSTLQRSTRYDSIKVTYRAPRRVREVVIVFEP